MAGVDGETVELSRDECLSLFDSAPFVRLAYVDGPVLRVIPVNARLDAAGVVLRTRIGSRTSARVDGASVALEADDVDVATRTGWAVTVSGTARVVHDTTELERLGELPLVPWVPGTHDVLVVVSPDTVTGRRIGGPEPAHPRP